MLQSQAGVASTTIEFELLGRTTTLVKVAKKMATTAAVVAEKTLDNDDVVDDNFMVCRTVCWMGWNGETITAVPAGAGAAEVVVR